MIKYNVTFAKSFIPSLVSLTLVGQYLSSSFFSPCLVSLPLASFSSTLPFFCSWSAVSGLLGLVQCFLYRCNQNIERETRCQTPAVRWDHLWCRKYE